MALLYCGGVYLSSWDGSSPCVPLERRVTANQCKVLLADSPHSIRKDFYPDWSGLIHDDSAHIHRARGLSEQFDQYKNDELPSGKLWLLELGLIQTPSGLAKNFIYNLQHHRDSPLPGKAHGPCSRVRAQNSTTTHRPALHSHRQLTSFHTIITEDSNRNEVT